MTIFNYDNFIINEALSTKEIKKTIRGVLGRSDRAKLRKVLRHNIVTFKFIKKDSSLRKAKGTLYPSYLPALRGGAPKPEHQFVYYDLDKHHWRSFRTFKFIKIVDIKPVAVKKTLSKKAKELEDKDDEEMKMKHSHEVDFEKEEMKKEKESEKKHHEEKHSEEDEHKKTYKAGDKIPEEELTRRSADFRKGSKKNKHTHEANDEFKKHNKEEKEHKEHHEEKHSEEDEHKKTHESEELKETDKKEHSEEKHSEEDKHKKTHESEDIETKESDKKDKEKREED